MEYYVLTVIRDSFFDEKIKYVLQKFVPCNEGTNAICYNDMGVDKFVFYKSEKSQLLDFLKIHDIKVARIDKKNIDFRIKQPFIQW